MKCQLCDADLATAMRWIPEHGNYAAALVAEARTIAGVYVFLHISPTGEQCTMLDVTTAGLTESEKERAKAFLYRTLYHSGLTHHPDCLCADCNQHRPVRLLRSVPPYGA